MTERGRKMPATELPTTSQTVHETANGRTPTIEQLMTYAHSLPDLYKRILWAFPSIHPGRKLGDGMEISSLARYFQALNLDYDSNELAEACRRLEETGLLEYKQTSFVHPTNVGERLIGVVSGKWAPKRELPELPTPNW